MCECVDWFELFEIYIFQTVQTTPLSIHLSARESSDDLLTSHLLCCRRPPDLRSSASRHPPRLQGGEQQVNNQIPRLVSGAGVGVAVGVLINSGTEMKQTHRTDTELANRAAADAT